MIEPNRPTVVSLFSGAGGIDIGFAEAGFRTIFATDNWEIACETLKRNQTADEIECADVRDIDFTRFSSENLGLEVDCLVGGPPCPSYSKSRFYLVDKPRALDDDDRVTLENYCRAIEEIRPRSFFFENVHGFLYKPHRASLEFLEFQTQKLGYQLTWKVLNAADYGVPQTRERFICIGTREDLPPFRFPDQTHGNLSDTKTLGSDEVESVRQISMFSPTHNSNEDRVVQPWVNCREAIGKYDYPLTEDADMQAGSKHSDLLKLIPPGENYLYLTAHRGYPDPKFQWRKRYWSFLLKLSPDRPSWTIQASFSNNMGPFHWTGRFLRISEIQALQTFPESIKFSGNFRAQWRLIGNAVPPLLARAVAQELYGLLDRSTQATADSLG